METVKDAIERALLLRHNANQHGYAYGFTSKAYFDALQPYLDFLEEMNITLISPHSSKPKANET